MKTNSLTKYNFSGEHYDFAEKKIGAESENLFFFNENVRITFQTDRVNRITMFSPSEFKVGSYLLNIKDSQGTTFLEGSKWVITSSDIVVDVFGRISGYKYKIARTLL